MRSGPDNWPCLRRPIDREGPSLAADEVGLALLEEGGHPLALVLGRERESEGVELPAEVALEITLESQVHDLLGGRDGPRRLGRDELAHLDRPVEQVCERDNVVDESGG